MSKILKHTHSMKKLGPAEIKGRKVLMYHCVHPDCFFKCEKGLLLGKRNICSCGSEFILTVEDLRRAFPKCINCSDTLYARLHKRIQELSNTAIKEDTGENSTDLSFTNLFKEAKNASS